MTITKTKLALAIVAVALVVPATAWATHVFDDVEHSRFYAEPAEWASNNNITTGVSTDPPLFAPDREVTRGETVTFLKRYDDNIVQPAVDDLQDQVDGMPTTYWAWVNSDGTLRAGSSGVSSSTSSIGEYVVTFPVDVDECSWSVAHRGVDGVLFVFDPNITSEPIFRLSTRASGIIVPVTFFTKDIRVNVQDPLSAQKNSIFQLEVTCFA